MNQNSVFMINENYKKHLKEPSLFESNYSLKIPRNPKIFFLLSKKKKKNQYLAEGFYLGRYFNRDEGEFSSGFDRKINNPTVHVSRYHLTSVSPPGEDRYFKEVVG